MARINENESSSADVMQTLQWARRHGFKPVALHPASKAAVNRSFVDPGYEPPSDSTWANNDYGIGIVTGPRANGPVDVDLDCTEAMFFAPRFLPRTQAIFGRKSKPASHYLYRIQAETFPKSGFLDPIENNTIVELRGDGHQTVFPGSIHQDTREPIEWASVPFPDVPTVEEQVLRKAVRKLAIAVLISRYMWASGQRNAFVLPITGLLYYLDWDVEEVCELIQAVQDYHGDEDTTRVKTVRLTFRKAERGGKVTGANTLRKMLGDDRLVDRILEWAGSPLMTLLQQYNEKYAVCSLEGKFRIADTEVEPGKLPTFMLKEDFLNLCSTDRMTIDDKPVSRAAVWLANPRRRSYQSVDFVPGVEEVPGTLNLWTGWAVEPVKGVCNAWLELLHSVICDGDDELYRWMLNWFANIVREPKSKPLTAPVMIGRQGAGKSLLLSYFGRILGGAYSVVTNEEHIYGRFNRHLAATLLLHSEEALYGGDKRHRGIIKSLITDDFRVFEQKGIDAKQVPNYLRLVLTSNHAQAAPAEVGDRRFTVIDLGQRKISEKLTNQVLDELKAGGAAALHAYLREIDYDPKLIRVNIKNEALADLKRVNLDPLEDWWYETLQSGYIVPDYLHWATEPKEQPWPAIVSSTALYQLMVNRLKERGQHRGIPTEAAFAQQLNRFTERKLTRRQKFFTNPMPDEAPQYVKLLGDRMSTIFDMPDLDHCRAAFERHLGQPVEWTEDATPEETPIYAKY